MDAMAEKKELRNFGLIVGGVFFLIGVWPLIRHGEGMRLWAVVLGTILGPLGRWEQSWYPWDWWRRLSSRLSSKSG